ATSCAYIYVVFLLLHHAPTTEIYTLSLHDALPILGWSALELGFAGCVLPISAAVGAGLGQTLVTKHGPRPVAITAMVALAGGFRSEEHTSELQSRRDIVCRLLLEKKKRRVIDSGEH